MSERPGGARSAGSRSEPAALFFLIVFVAAVYGLRPSLPPLQGEETRWAVIATEMLATGDWLVPHFQGLPYLDRPSLGVWLIAIAMKATGSTGAAAVRAPALLATAGTVLLVYAYGRLFLTVRGALAAALVLATMAQVQEIGRRAEYESILMFALTAALLGWHALRLRRRSPLLAWCVGYGFAALGAFAKGPQAPVYFVLASWGVLFWSGRIRELLRPSHLVATLALAAPIAVWTVLFASRVGLSEAAGIWLWHAAVRFEPRPALETAGHLALFPLAVAVALLPWSPVLLFYVDRSFRRSLATITEPIRLLTLAVGAGFASCWLAPYAHPRYFLPLAPCVALLVGCALEHVSGAEPGSLLGRLRRAALRFASGAAALLGLAVAAATLFPSSIASAWTQPGGFAAFYLASGLAVAAILAREAGRAATARLAPVILLSCFSAATVSGVYENRLTRADSRTDVAVADLKRMLPRNARLVSLGPVNHRFAYHYGSAIERVKPSEAAPLLSKDGTFFCATRRKGERLELPFSYEEEAVVGVERFAARPGALEVVIGRLLVPPEAEPPSLERKLEGHWKRHETARAARVALVVDEQALRDWVKLGGFRN